MSNPLDTILAYAASAGEVLQLVEFLIGKARELAEKKRAHEEIMVEVAETTADWLRRHSTLGQRLDENRALAEAERQKALAARPVVPAEVPPASSTVAASPAPAEATSSAPGGAVVEVVPAPAGPTLVEVLAELEKVSTKFDGISATLDRVDRMTLTLDGMASTLSGVLARVSVLEERTTPPPAPEPLAADTTVTPVVPSVAEPTAPNVVPVEG